MRFVIIGAGLCGLTAAHNLLLEGHEVAIYEKNDYIGGMAASRESKGYSYDQGVHIFHMMDNYASDLIRKLLNNNLYTREFTAKTLINGIFYEYPPSVEKVMDLPGLLPAPSLYSVMTVLLKNEPIRKNSPKGFR